MRKGEVGDVYTDYASFSHTNAFRLQTKEYKLERVSIYVSGTLIYVGTQSRQIYPVATTKTLTLHNIDMADLWFKGDGNAEEVFIIGTTK